MLGCCCSIDHIRKHGSFWAKARVASDELMQTNNKFWRASFDNLNFKMKYAKKMTASGPKKMLNLITAQVCVRTSPTLHNILEVGGLSQMHYIIFLNHM